MNSSQQQANPGHGRADPAPYLTHLVTHQGQLTVVSPQNASHTRKRTKSKHTERRQERRRDSDEPRFNTAAPPSPRANPRRMNNASARIPRQATPNMPQGIAFSRDTIIPDEPPPSFQEAIADPSPPFIVAPPPDARIFPGASATTEEEEDTPSLQPQTSFAEVSSPRVEVPLPPVQVSSPNLSSEASDPSPTSSSSQTSSPEQTGIPSDGSDRASEHYELVTFNASDDWELGRHLGLPLDARVDNWARHHLSISTDPTLPLSAPRLTARDVDPAETPNHPVLPHRCSHCGCMRTADCDLESHTPSESTRDSDSPSPPSSPRSKAGWKKLFLPISSHDAKSDPSSPLATSPKSPVTNLPGAWTSNLTLALTKPSFASFAKRKDSSGLRRLFGSSKGKERESPAEAVEDQPDNSSEELESWEDLADASNVSVANGKDEDIVVKRSRGDSIQPLSTAHTSDSHPPAVAPVAFLNRVVRPTPQPSSAHVFPSSPSTVSLSATASRVNVADLIPEKRRPTAANSDSALVTKGKTRIPPPLLQSPRRPTPSLGVGPSIVWRSPLSGGSSEDATTPRSPQTNSPTHLQVSHTVHPLATAISSPNLSLARLTVPQTTVMSSRGRAEAVAVASPAEGIASSPPTRFRATSHHVSPTTRPSPLSSPESLSGTPPETPTTPTAHHYPGRPLPQTPRQPSPLGRPILPSLTMTAPEAPIAHDRVPHTDLDLLASTVIEGDHNGNNYEDMLTISEPTTVSASPDSLASTPDTPTRRFPAVGRVQLQMRRMSKDGRVKVKLFLMGVPVDKCCICLSQFKEAEVATHGTNCKHAFHEYCLKRWLVRSQTCPLCRAHI